MFSLDLSEEQHAEELSKSLPRSLQWIKYFFNISSSTKHCTIQFSFTSPHTSACYEGCHASVVALDSHPSIHLAIYPENELMDVKDYRQTLFLSNYKLEYSLWHWEQESYYGKAVI